MTALLHRLAAALAPAPDHDQVVAAAPAVAVRDLARRFWPGARRLRRPFLAGMALAALLPAVEAAEIWLFKLLVDHVLVPADLGALPPYAAAMVALALLGATLSFGDEYLATWVGERFTLDLRTALLEHLQRLSPDQLDRRRPGDVLARMTGDVDAIETVVLSAPAEAVQAAARIAFFAAALALVSWKLALAALVVVPGFVLASRCFSRLARRAAREGRRRSGSLSAVAEESLANTALVQAANAQARERARFVREGEGAMAAELAATRVAGLFAPVIDLIELTGALLVIVLGTLALGAGEVTLGGLLAFLAYLARLYGPVRGLSRLAATVFGATAGGERVVELLDTAPAVTERADAIALDSTSPCGRAALAKFAGTLAGPTAGALTSRAPLPAAPPALALDGVRLRYPGAARPAVDGVSLAVDPGRCVAVIGASGAGKSTLAKLALRFADPDAGTVRLDGHDVRDVRLRCLREHVALLPQDPQLLDASVRDNVAYARPGASDREVAAALRRAAAPELVARLHDGVGQRGRALSGGQRRRVAIARALLQDAAVLVLDEPTAGLDAPAARRLVAPLRAVMRERAVLLVTHDLLLAREADEIVVLEDGQVVERGAPAALLGAGGAYARMHGAAGLAVAA